MHTSHHKNRGLEYFLALYVHNYSLCLLMLSDCGARVGLFVGLQLSQFQWSLPVPTPGSCYT